MVDLEELKQETVKDVVKDFMGAVQVKNLLEGSPNTDILKNGDLITKVNGNRIENKIQFIKQIEMSPNKKNIYISLIREGKLINSNIKVINSTDKIIEEKDKLVNVICSKLPETKSRPFYISRIPASK